VATLDPERRFYPATGFRTEEQTTTEVKIERLPSEDLYVYFEGTQDGGFLFTFFRKPLITVVWLGWLVMIAGGLFAAVPFAKKKVGLAA
jgi:cytochrome c-type biogenesis protein CcmF